MWQHITGGAEYTVMFQNTPVDPWFSLNPPRAAYPCPLTPRTHHDDDNVSLLPRSAGGDFGHRGDHHAGGPYGLHGDRGPMVLFVIMVFLVVVENFVPMQT